MTSKYNNKQISIKKWHLIKVCSNILKLCNNSLIQLSLIITTWKYLNDYTFPNPVSSLISLFSFNTTLQYFLSPLCPETL